MSSPIVQIKRAQTRTKDDPSTLNGLLAGELGYYIDQNELYIGIGNLMDAPQLINVKNTAGASENGGKLYLIGAQTQDYYAPTFTNGLIYIENNRFVGPEFFATKEYDQATADDLHAAWRAELEKGDAERNPDLIAQKWQLYKDYTDQFIGNATSSTYWIRPLTLKFDGSGILDGEITFDGREGTVVVTPDQLMAGSGVTSAFVSNINPGEADNKAHENNAGYSVPSDYPVTEKPFSSVIDFDELVKLTGNDKAEQIRQALMGLNKGGTLNPLNYFIVKWDSQGNSEDKYIPVIRKIETGWDQDSGLTGPRLRLAINNIYTHVEPMPLASTVTSGVVNTGEQQFAGSKTFEPKEENGYFKIELSSSTPGTKGTQFQVNYASNDAGLATGIETNVTPASKQFNVKDLDTSIDRTLEVGQRAHFGSHVITEGVSQVKKTLIINELDYKPDISVSNITNFGSLVSYGLYVGNSRLDADGLEEKRVDSKFYGNIVIGDTNTQNNPFTITLGDTGRNRFAKFIGDIVSVNNGLNDIGDKDTPWDRAFFSNQIQTAIPAKIEDKSSALSEADLGTFTFSATDGKIDTNIPGFVLAVDDVDSNGAKIKRVIGVLYYKANGGSEQVGNLTLGNKSNTSGEITIFNSSNLSAKLRVTNKNVKNRGNGQFYLPLSNSPTGILTYVQFAEEAGNGTTQELIETVGNNARPVYVDLGGKVTPFGSTIGAAGQPVYVNGGTITAIDWHIGNATVGEHDANNMTYNGLMYYTSNGPANDTVMGASVKDGGIYVQAYNSTWVGQIAQDYRNGRLWVRGKNNNVWQAWKGIPYFDNQTKGGTLQPVYLANGAITPLSGTKGSGTNPVYFSNGVITASSSNVGSGVKPMYMANGILTASSSNVGSTALPVYMTGGNITVIPAGSKLNMNINGHADLDLPLTGGTLSGNLNFDGNYQININNKAYLTVDGEGGNLRLVSPNGTYHMEMDCFDNNEFRIYVGTSAANSEALNGLSFKTDEIITQKRLRAGNNIYLETVGADGGRLLFRSGDNVQQWILDCYNRNVRFYTFVDNSYVSPITLTTNGYIIGNLQGNINNTLVQARDVDTNFVSNFRPEVYGNGYYGDFITAIRNNDGGVNASPQFGTGLAFGRADTHSYIYTAYNSPELYVGGGNNSQLLWTRRIPTATGEGASGNWNIHATADLALSGGTLNGNLVIQKNNPYLILQNTASDNYTIISFKTDSSNDDGVVMFLNGANRPPIDGDAHAFIIRNQIGKIMIIDAYHSSAFMGVWGTSQYNFSTGLPDQNRLTINYGVTFSNSPVVLATANTSYPNNNTCSVSNRTKTDFRLNVYRGSSDSEMWYSWIAIRVN